MNTSREIHIEGPSDDEGEPAAQHRWAGHVNLLHVFF